MSKEFDFSTEDEAATQVVNDLEQTAPLSYEALDVEVEKRFEVALYYRLLLKDSLFNESTEAAQIVEGKVRAFIRDQLEVLMGMKAIQAERSPDQFTSEEVEALRRVAAKILGKPALLTETSQGQEPSLRKAAVPAKPAPAIRKRGPGTSKPIAEPKPTMAPTAIPKPKPKPEPKKPRVEGEDEGEEGEVIEENGKKYKLCRNELGTMFRLDVSGQIVPPNRIPPPTGAQLAAMTERAAQIQSSGTMVTGTETDEHGQVVGGGTGISCLL